MCTCRVCNQKFNVGFTPASGAICIQCANIEGNMLKQDQWLLEDFKSRLSVYDAKVEPAKLLSSKLLKSMLFALFGPILGIIVLGFIWAIFYLLNAPTIGGVIFSIGVFIIGLIGFLFSLNWLSIIGDALVAKNQERVMLQILLCFFIPLYAIFLTFYVRAELRQKGDAIISYGRLKAV